jgi:hypothetical protein
LEFQPMRIRRLTNPAIESVFHRIAAFEFFYRLSTRDFLRQQTSHRPVPPDHAIEWNNLLEELSLLEEEEIARMSASYAARNEPVMRCNAARFL